jgi:hypothetical protein
VVENLDLTEKNPDEKKPEEPRTSVNNFIIDA